MGGAQRRAATVGFRKRDDSTEDSCAAQRFDFGIERFKEIGVDGYALGAAKGSQIMGVRPGRGDPLRDRELLGGADTGVKLPIFDRRNTRPVPNCVREPKERRSEERRVGKECRSRWS